ncbi:triacylglycerol lipase [Marmoricola sp. URHB0036]|uniref:esterase/lipase family protein n=1 Tax=Marmoricola sp. URHB0036 TaxID=1298863 RepID=UPI0003F85EA3|nr:alpha/beta fold hydrolase [Marmoricola sp. URHB0036]
MVVGALVIVLVVGLVALVVARSVSGGGAADQSQPGAVIVVPGYGGTASDVTPIVDELRREGRTAIAFQPTGGGTGDLRVQAKRLADLAQRTIDRTGIASVDVVGYSAGGVIARLFVRDDGGDSVVRRVLTLGSPHHGTDVAAIAADVGGGCPTACEQMATGSDLVRRLNAGDETPAGPRWITIRTHGDRTVTPTDSAELEGALNIEVQEVCPGATTTHGGLPSDPVVLATLVSALGTGQPRAPTGVTC